MTNAFFTVPVPVFFGVNANVGKLVSTFGQNGIIDLHEGLAPDSNYDVGQLSISSNTPGIVHKNILIVGSTVPESGDAAQGSVRAFDILTGKLQWVFHTVARPGELGYNTWPKDAWEKNRCSQ